MLSRSYGLLTLAGAFSLVLLTAYVLLPNGSSARAAHGTPAGGHLKKVGAGSPGEVARMVEGEDPRAEADPAREVIRNIVSRCFNQRSDAAAGKFLKDFDAMAALVEDLDIERMRPLRRGSSWAQLEAPYLPPGRTKQPEMTAWLRFVEKGGKWKLEGLKLLPWSMAP